jgi:ACS family glucarate transporter-like MFS transporter
MRLLKLAASNDASMTQSTFPNPIQDQLSRPKSSGVIVAVVIVSFLTILARTTISGAKPEMAHDLHINDVEFGLVFGAFALGYAVFMLPCGLLADRWGPRKSLALSVFFWALFTVLTGVVSAISILVTIRFLFGLAEAGVYPQATRALLNWVRPQALGLALGLLNLGSRLGAAFGLALTPLMISEVGWRQSFIWLGIVGTAWSAVWFFWFRDRPAKEAADKGEPIPTSSRMPRNFWGSFVKARNVYLILYQYFASQFTFFICLSWLLPYLRSRYHIPPQEAGVLASLPLCAGVLSMWIGGSSVDYLYKTNSIRKSRTLPAMIGFGLAATVMLIAPYIPTAPLFIACFAVITFGVDLTISPSWTVCCDVGGDFAGTLSAAMNTFGALGSLASSLLFPASIARYGTIKPYFILASLFNFVAILCWRIIDPKERIIAADANTSSSSSSVEQFTPALHS